MKTKQPRCCICNRFTYTDMKDIDFHWIDFNDVETGEETYAHKDCFFNLSFNERQKIVNSAASKGNLPMESMYANMKEQYDKLSRQYSIVDRELSVAQNKIIELEYITRWHKFPDEIPDTKYEDTFWVTTINGVDIERDVFANNKWTYNGIDVIAWAYILIPKLFNDLCYPGKLNMYKYIDR